ncbi:MAG: FtsX-like permease family protein [Pseudomonadota bacterium]
MEIRPILSTLMRSKTGAILVALQIAISLAILSNALHIVNLRLGVANRPSGIADEASVFYMQVRHLREGGHIDQLATKQSEMETLRAVAGVQSVAFVNQIPLSQSGGYNSVAVDPKQVDMTADASYYTTPDSLVKTWGLQLLEGRDFLPEDVVEIDNTVGGISPRSVIITKALADKAWPGNSGVVGKTLYYGSGAGAEAVRIVGVVARLQSQSATLDPKAEFSTIVAAIYTNAFGTIYTVRATPGQLQRVIKDAEAALAAHAASPLIVRSHTMEQTRNKRYRADMSLAWMLIAVCVLLLLITASGIVGMASLWVTQRRKQIGVRRALGARRIDILRYFLTENFMISSVGVGAGIVLAIGLNQLLVTRLEMSRLPLSYLVSGATIFWALGAAAVYGPAWRAAAISPALATRSA